MIFKRLIKLISFAILDHFIWVKANLLNANLNGISKPFKLKCLCLPWEWYGSAPYQYHMTSRPSLWECYVFGNNPYNSQIIQACWPMIWEWYGKLAYNLHMICRYAASDMGIIWFFNQFVSNLVFSVNSCDASYYWMIFSSFTSQSSEVIMPLINALINYSKLGAQYHILCIHQFDTLKLNFVLIGALIYKHITTFQQLQKLKKPKKLL